MIVTREGFKHVLEELKRPGQYALDTETTGLRPYHGDRMFSLIIAGPSGGFYFNFQPYKGEPEKYWLDDSHKKELVRFFRETPEHTWFMHKAKYDMHILAQDDMFLAGPAHDTMCVARLLYNQRKRISLAACVEELPGSEAKTDVVGEYISKHKLYKRSAKGKPAPLYYKVPLPLVSEYGINDGIITRKLGLWQLEKAKELDSVRPKNAASLMEVIENENKLVKVIFHVERAGVRVDRKYVENAIESEKEATRKAKEEFKALTGVDFVASGKALGEVFQKVGIELPKTLKGASKTDEKTLMAIDHEIVRIIQRIKKPEKQVGTYFSNFLTLKDRYGDIHCSLDQHGAVTGRFTCSNPNLQNLKKAEEGDDPDALHVRKSFKPRKDYCFFLPDYEQMEYRLMLDYAGEMEVIKQIIGGIDVHQATADITGLSRKDAKTFNFAFLYGAGLGKLAQSLGKTVEETRKIKSGFESKLQKVTRFIGQVKNTAHRRGYITNWLGRRCYFDSESYYTAPNHLIQGGCADIVKVAMVRCYEFLAGRRSRMILNIHDEIVFEIHKDELSICPELCKIMEESYSATHLPMAVEPSFSWKSLGEKKKGFPC